MKSNNPYGVAPNSADAEATPQFAPVKNNGLAIASLVLGILSFLLWIFAAIPGIITGHMALSRAKNNPQEYAGDGMAIIGLILSYLMLVVSILLLGWFAFMFTSIPGFQEAFQEGFNQGVQQSTNPQ